MNRHFVWSLTVHFYPKAAAAQVRPIDVRRAACDRCLAAEGKINPASYYNSHTFQFDHPPSREDFLFLVRAIPWMSCWDKDLVPLLLNRANQWPVITMGYKASSADVLDEQGRKVGELDVRHEEVFQNQRYYSAFVTVDAVNKATCRLGFKRDAAREYIEKYENRIRERTTELGREKHDMPDRFLDQAIREVLVKGGFIKAKPSRKREQLATVEQ
jgi:hypothetical protein